MLELRAQKTLEFPWGRRKLVLWTQQGLTDDSYPVLISQWGRCFEVPRRGCYRLRKAAPKLNLVLVGPTKPFIDKEPSFGYRIVAQLRCMNKNTVHRIFQISGWQVLKRSIGRPSRHRHQWRSVLTSISRRIFVASSVVAMLG